MSVGSLELETEKELLKMFRRYPSLPAEPIFHEATVFLAITPKLFKQHRSAKHLARIICSLYWVRHHLGETGNLPHSTTLFRLMPSTLSFPFGRKQALGLCVGVSQLGEYQHFSEKNVIQVVSSQFPEAQLVEQSPLTFQRPQDTTVCLYCEMEKSSATPFTVADIRSLRHHLQQSLHTCIEQLTPIVIPLCNEEEKMKDVVALREEIHSLDDPPQVVIHLEEQAPSHLTFAVTLVRPFGERTRSWSQLFQNLSPDWTYIPLRTRDVSLSKDRHKREAHFFRMQLNNLTPFTRADSSINLPLARQHVVDVLTHHLGSIRDYAGGMMFLQNTLFAQLREHYPTVDAKFLEDFYYSLTPTQTLLTLPDAAVNTLLDMILDLQKASSQNNPIGKKKQTPKQTFITLRFPHTFPDRLLTQNLSHYPRLVSTAFRYKEHKILAFIYHSEDTTFLPALEKDLNTILAQDPSAQTLRLCTEIFPLSLDPRITLISSTNHIFKMLFDGLMRLDAEGVPHCAVAESTHISPDCKTYTFKLRESYWNNGDPVTAHDFAYTWKKILSPTFKTPYAYLFYLIRNAKEVKRGDLPIDSVGISAPDSQTLIVNLEHPAPYFLNYLALSLFFPVNHRIDQVHPNWHLATSTDYICNGPFSLSTITPGRSLHLTKNPTYWDHPHVHLQAIHIDIAQSSTIFERFQNNQVDWVGPPITHSNPPANLSCSGEKQIWSHPFTHWLIVNTNCFPLKNKKLRQAFFHAIDRRALIKSLPDGEAIPAYSTLPPAFSTLKDTVFYDEQKAKMLFSLALEEMESSELDFPKLTLLHAAEIKSPRYHLLLSLKNQIQQVLGIELELQAVDWQVAARNIRSNDYQLCFASWQYLANTPFYFLDSFHESDEGSPYQWEIPDYQQALKGLRNEGTIGKQEERLAQVEHILMEELPLVPLYHYSGYFYKNQNIIRTQQTQSIGVVDFKESTINRTPKLLTWL